MLSLVDRPLLTDSFPPTDPHNIGARLLRHGLAVSAFSSLERYLASRFDSLASSIEGSALSFSSLRSDLQMFLSREAAVGLISRMGFLDEGLRQAFFDAQITKVAGYGATPAIYTALGFSPKGSNVGHEDIKKAFAAFGIKDAWGKLGHITSLIGVSRLSLRDDYIRLVKARHASAHDPESNVPTVDLRTNIQTSILIGMSVDVLCSGIASVYSTSSSLPQLDAKLSGMGHLFRFVDEEVSGTFVERATAGGAAIKRYATEAAAATTAASRVGSQHIIIRNTTRVPVALV